jgi:hypothetical protein
LDEDGGGFGGEVYTKTSGEAFATAKELKARGKLEALVPLLDHPSTTVRVKAANYCQNVAEDKARHILQGLAENLNTPEGREASVILSFRRLGNYDPL